MANKPSIHSPNHPTVLATMRRSQLPSRPSNKPTYYIDAPIVEIKQGKIFLPDQMDGLPSNIRLTLAPAKLRKQLKAKTRIKIGMVGTKPVSVELA